MLLHNALQQEAGLRPPGLCVSGDLHVLVLARLAVDAHARRGDPAGVLAWLDAGLHQRLDERAVGVVRQPATLLRGTIEAIADDEHPALALVRVRVGGAAVVARLTRRSAHTLELAVGMPVWAQVKTVALME